MKEVQFVDISPFSESWRSVAAALHRKNMILKFMYLDEESGKVIICAHEEVPRIFAADASNPQHWIITPLR